MGEECPGSLNIGGVFGPPLPVTYDIVPQTHNFLDGFYMSRIGIRILIGHYLALQVQNKNFLAFVSALSACVFFRRVSRGRSSELSREAKCFSALHLFELGFLEERGAASACARVCLRIQGTTAVFLAHIEACFHGINLISSQAVCGCHDDNCCEALMTYVLHVRKFHMFAFISPRGQR